MSSILAGAGKSFMRMDLGHGLVGPVGLAVETLAELGTGATVGYIYQHNRGKFLGRNIATLTALVGKGLSVLTSVAMKGEQNLLTGGLNAIGSAGVTLKGLELGLELARRREKVRAVIVARDAKVPAELHAVEVDTVGELPAAPPGRTMDWDLVDKLADMH